MLRKGPTDTTSVILSLGISDNCLDRYLPYNINFLTNALSILSTYNVLDFASDLF